MKFVGNLKKYFREFYRFFVPSDTKFHEISDHLKIFTDLGCGGCLKSSNKLGEIPDFPIWGDPGLSSAVSGVISASSFSRSVFAAKYWLRRSCSICTCRPSASAGAQVVAGPLRLFTDL